jgi:hypothetical protein
MFNFELNHCNQTYTVNFHYNYFSDLTVKKEGNFICQENSRVGLERIFFISSLPKLIESMIIFSLVE